MARARAAVRVPGPVAEVEALWFDLARWPAFVDGFAAVAKCDGGWPQSGRLVWDSTPAGRGRVVEHVTAYTPAGGQTAEVEDEKLLATQTVSFEAEPEGEHVQVSLVLEYRLKDRNPLTPVIDLLFIRRALNDALRRTVVRFARERAGDVELGAREGGSR